MVRLERSEILLRLMPKCFFVATGVAERTKSKTYSGPVDGLITEIELLAWDLMELDPPDRLTNKQLGIPQIGVQAPRQKTRFGALIRSTMIPGWGQFYSNRSLMGWTMLGSEIAIGALAFTQYSAYQTANDDFIDFQAQYRASINPTEITDLKQQAQSSYFGYEHCQGSSDHNGVCRWCNMGCQYGTCGNHRP